MNKNNVSIRQKLHNYLEVATDQKVKAIYTIIKDEVEQSLLDYSDETKAEFDKRYSDYKSGEAKVLTAEESKTRIKKLLKTLPKK